LMATEDLGTNEQLVRVRSWPVYRLPAVVLVCLFTALAFGAAWDRAWFPSSLLAFVAFATAFRAGWEAGTVTSLVKQVLSHLNS
jgi:hypothetical protein